MKPRLAARGNDGVLYIDGVAQARGFVAPTPRPRNTRKKRPAPIPVEP